MLHPADAARDMTTLPQPGAPAQGYAAIYDAWLTPDQARQVVLVNGGLSVVVREGGVRRVEVLHQTCHLLDR